MPVLIIHDPQSARNLYHSFTRNLYRSFKRDREKNKLKIESFAKDLIEEFIDWLYDNEFSITQLSK